MSWNFMRWSWLTLCSAPTNLSGCPDHMFRWCSFILVFIDGPVCPIHTWLHLQGILYISGVPSPRSSFTGQRELEILLGGWPTLCCSVWPAFCWANCMSSGHIAGEWDGLVFWLEVLIARLRARHFCLRLYSFSLEVVLKRGGFACHTEPCLCAPNLRE